MGRAISNKNVCDAQFEVAEFTGAWLESFGKPELQGSWIIWGGSGGGKTTFALQLLKYLSQFVDRVAYNSLEQGLSLSFQTAWRRVGMHEVGRKAIMLNKEPLNEMKERLRKKRSPKVVIIDSITAIETFTRPMYLKLIKEFPDKLFIFLAHESNNMPHPAVAEYVRKLSDIKIRVEGNKGFVITRFDTDEGEGGRPFTIWEKGASEYWAEIKV